MHYLGGKHRIRKHITTLIQDHMKPSSVYFEPFIGAGSIFVDIQAAYKIGSDQHEDLIMMWQALINGWKPPMQISEEEYKEIRASQPSALRGFVGFACSFAGKWFGGYARGDHTNYTSCGANSLNKKTQKIAGGNVEFVRASYEWITPYIMPGDVVYCDPPYAKTTKYSIAFDSDLFWEWVRANSKRATILVSEYNAPEDFTCVLEIATKTDLRSKENKVHERLERVFMHNGG